MDATVARVVTLFLAPALITGYVLLLISREFQGFLIWQVPDRFYRITVMILLIFIGAYLIQQFVKWILSIER